MKIVASVLPVVHTSLFCFWCFKTVLPSWQSFFGEFHSTLKNANKIVKKKLPSRSPEANMKQLKPADCYITNGCHMSSFRFLIKR